MLGFKAVTDDMYGYGNFKFDVGIDYYVNGDILPL